jgi:hypothetical protein
MMAERLRQHPKAVRNGSSAALILVGVLALYNWILAPHLGCLQAKHKLSTAIGQVAEEKDRICSTLEAKVSQWHALQQEAAELEAGVFRPEQAQMSVKGLLPLVEGTGCEIVLADFAPKGKPERTEDPNGPVAIEAAHLNLVATGQPEQVATLLQRLEGRRPRVWVDSCELDFRGGNEGRVECNLLLTLYTIEIRKEPARE